MNLLNAEEMGGFKGGATPSCSTGVVGCCAGAVGDAILPTNCKLNDYVLCARYQISCSKSVGTTCNEIGFTFDCLVRFTDTCISGHPGNIGGFTSCLTSVIKGDGKGWY